MNQVAKVNGNGGEIIEAVVARGDLGKLNPDERSQYYAQVCKSVGLNPLTRPFEYLTLNNKLVLYARKDCTDQLRQIHNVSVTDLIETERDGVFVVTAKVVNANGRADAAKGAVTIIGLKGDALANALMKAETKAKRRATLSICGLGFLDETELDTIPQEAKDTRLTTLPKKDAREIFTKLQNDVNAATSRPLLKQWGSENADRIKVLPEDWQDILRLKFEEKMADLRQQESALTDQVVWEETGERPATAEDLATPEDGSIPPYLDRTKDKPKVATAADVFDPAQWLRDLDGAFSGCEDYVSLGEKQKKLMLPHKGKAFPVDWDKAVKLFNANMSRIGTSVMGAG